MQEVEPLTLARLRSAADVWHATGRLPSAIGPRPELADVTSRAGKRVLTLPQPLAEALRAHRTARLEERLAAGSCWWSEPAAPKGMGWDLVFRQPDGEPGGHQRDHAEWKALLADAGVRDARLHDARHTAASLLLLLKGPARVVMEMFSGTATIGRRPGRSGGSHRETGAASRRRPSR